MFEFVFGMDIPQVIIYIYILITPSLIFQNDTFIFANPKLLSWLQVILLQTLLQAWHVLCDGDGIIVKACDCIKCVLNDQWQRRGMASRLGDLLCLLKATHRTHQTAHILYINLQATFKTFHLVNIKRCTCSFRHTHTHWALDSIGRVFLESGDLLCVWGVLCVCVCVCEICLLYTYPSPRD